MSSVLAIGCAVTLLLILGAGLVTALKPLGRFERRELSIIAAALTVLLTIKCLLLPLFQGFVEDYSTFLEWGEKMHRGVWALYEPEGWCRYTPAYIYALWMCVAIPRHLYFGNSISASITSKLLVIVRVPPIVADLMVAVLIYAWSRRLREKPRTQLDLAAVALFALNPALIYNSMVWGQNDSALMLTVILALLLAVQENFAMAAALATMAVMIKLQGIIVLPVLATWMVARARARDWLAAFAASAGVVAVTIAPFQIHRSWNFLAKVMMSSADYFPLTSLNSFNLMGLVAGQDVPDSRLVLGMTSFHLGLVLIAMLFVFVVLMLWRDPSPRMLLYSAFIAYLGFFMLPTRIHERYLYFALALLTPLALDSWGTVTMFSILTVTFYLNDLVILQIHNRIISSDLLNIYGNPAACANLIVLAIAIAYELFLISRDRSRWPLPLRAYFDRLMPDAVTEP